MPTVKASSHDNKFVDVTYEVKGERAVNVAFLSGQPIHAFCNTITKTAEFYIDKKRFYFYYGDGGRKAPL